MNNENNWISVKERLPVESDYPMWVTDGITARESDHAYLSDPKLPYSKGGSTEWDLTITHFCPKPKQEPPPLPHPTSASEKAFQNFIAVEGMGRYGDDSFSSDAVNAAMGIAWHTAWTAALTAKEGRI